MTAPRYYPAHLNPGDTHWYVIDRTTGQPVVWVSHRTKRAAQAIADQLIDADGPNSPKVDLARPTSSAPAQARSRTDAAPATAADPSTVSTMAAELDPNDPRVKRAREISDDMTAARQRISQLARERADLVRSLRDDGIGMTAIAAALEISRQQLYTLLEHPEQPTPSTSRATRTAGAPKPKRGSRG